MKNLGLLVLLVAFTACESSGQHKFGWLAGTWKLKGKAVYETWSVDDNGSMSGLTYSVNGVDTIVRESIRLTYEGGYYHYIPDVAENASPVDFKITAFSNSHFIAENPDHDFPKVIVYTIVRKPEGEIIEASIEGNGQVILYAFEKVR